MTTQSPNPTSLLQSRISNLMGWDFSQLGMAERFISEHGRAVRYCNKWNTWLVWSGARWEIDESSAINRLAHKTIRTLKKKAKDLYADVEHSRISDTDIKSGMKDTLRRLIAHAGNFEEHRELMAMLNSAATLADVSITPDMLDTGPMLLNCRNGVVDLAKGTLIPHEDSRGYLLTKMAPVEYHPDAACPRWLQFLDEVFAGDVAKIAYIQKSIGYGITGSVTEKAMWFLHGGGNNGKTTLLAIIRSLLGDYAGIIDINTLMRKQVDDYSLRMIAMLQGKRFVTASEPSEGCRLNEALIKHMTGMDDLVGRHIYGKSFQFPPVHKILIDGNHRPAIQGTDDAIWLRIRLVPFEVKFSDNRKNWPLERCR
jgi:putative DNA primase/helicase